MSYPSSITEHNLQSWKKLSPTARGRLLHNTVFMFNMDELTLENEFYNVLTEKKLSFAEYLETLYDTYFACPYEERFFDNEYLIRLIHSEYLPKTQDMFEILYYHTTRYGENKKNPTTAELYNTFIYKNKSKDKPQMKLMKKNNANEARLRRIWELSFNPDPNMLDYVAHTSQDFEELFAVAGNPATSEDTINYLLETTSDDDIRIRIDARGKSSVTGFGDAYEARED